MPASPPDIFALSVEHRLDMVAALRDPTRRVEPLPGGLTNQNFKVTTTSGTFVARLSRPSSELLAINRDHEYQNSQKAAACHIAPTVVDYAPDAGVLTIGWLAGRTLTPTDLRSPEILRSVAESCRKLHDGEKFGSDFDMFDVAGRYLQTVLDRGFRLPDRYLDFTGQWAQVRSVLSMDAPATVPCHNDLLAGNFIDDGKQLWMIDYEYSGNNDPCFELGNIWSEADLGEAELHVLVDHYFGGHRPDMIARTRLQGLVSQYGWTLWGAIQQSVSDLDFDFWSWSMEKYDRAVATFERPDFDDLLAAVAAGPAQSSNTTTRTTSLRSTIEKENPL